MKITSASPVLQVSDLRKAISFYCDVLGFAEEFVYGEPPFYAAVKMDGVSLHLCSSAANAGRRGLGSVYVFCDKVDKYYERIRGKGVEVTSALDAQPYGMRDFQIKDSDGNLIGFGCPLEDEGKG